MFFSWLVMMGCAWNLHLRNWLRNCHYNKLYPQNELWTIKMDFKIDFRKISPMGKNRRCVRLSCVISFKENNCRHTVSCTAAFSRLEEKSQGMSESDLKVATGHQKVSNSCVKLPSSNSYVDLKFSGGLGNGSNSVPAWHIGCPSHCQTGWKIPPSGSLEKYLHFVQMCEAGGTGGLSF